MEYLNKYAEVLKDGTFKIINKPKWFSNDGVPLTNEKLLEHNIYKIKANVPIEDSAFYNIEEKPMSEWEISQKHVIVKYNITPKNSTEIKNFLKKQLSLKRWNLENFPISIKLPNKTISIECNRDNRKALLELKDHMNSNSKVDFKLNGTFYELTYSDVKYILKKINEYIQSLYTKEKNLSKKIENAEFEELKYIKNIDINKF